AVLVGGLSVFLATRKAPVLLEETSTIAKVVAIRGEANLTTTDGPVPVTVGQVLRPGDVLSTGADSEAVVSLPDDARVELRSETKVRILPPDMDSWVDLIGGSVRTEVTRADPMTVNTPHAMIRAAIALTSVADDGTTVTAEAERTHLTRKTDRQSREVEPGATMSTETMVPVKPRDAFRFTNGSVTHAAVSADGVLAVCTSDARVVLCKVDSMNVPVLTRKFNGQRVGGPAFAADGHWVVATADGQKAYVYDGPSGEVRITTDRQPTEIRAVALSPDGGLLAVGGRMWRGMAGVKVFDGRTGKELTTLDVGGSVNAVAFTPDGRTLAAVGADSAVRRWDVQTWKPLGIPVSLPGEALAVAYSPDGRRLAVGGRDGLLRLMRADNTVVALEAPSVNVTALTLSPDGTRLAVAAGDTVWVWDVSADPQVHRTIPAHRDRVTAVAYTADGKSLVTAGGDGNVKVWNVD
ncbi:MAG TPA: LpqB family beta-propeller domain-containing protein, partial [Gemmataceae bacterium]|nr:LpqB family beta-propeller domain-containing protein [Gemmataceae bacterium]